MIATCKTPQHAKSMQPHTFFVILIVSEDFFITLLSITPRLIPRGITASKQNLAFLAHFSIKWNRSKASHDANTSHHVNQSNRKAVDGTESSSIHAHIFGLQPKHAQNV
jgi:hypothetical protein